MMPTATSGECKNDKISIREAMQRVMELVREHSQEDRELFQAMFLHAIRSDNQTEVEDAFETMVEILQDNGAKSATSISNFELPNLGNGRDGPSEDGPKTRQLKAWTGYVAKRVKKNREEAGLTQQQLAEKSGLTQSHVCRIETGAHSASRKTLVKIAAALGIPLSRLDPIEEDSTQ